MFCNIFFFHDNIVGESDAHSLVQKEKCGFKRFDFLKVFFPKIIEYPGLTASSNDPLCFHDMNCLNFFNSEELVNHCWSELLKYILLFAFEYRFGYDKCYYLVFNLIFVFVCSIFDARKYDGTYLICA